MLVCPQCQFDNPDENKFCQRCGESLIHKLCPKCQVSVPWWSLTCPECGTQTGQTWLALIFTSTPDSSFGQPATLSNPDDLEVAQAIATSPSATISLDGDSLDVNHLAGAISNSPGIEDSTLDRLDAPASDSDSVDSEVPTPVKISQLMDSAASSTMVEPTEPTEPPVWLNQTFDVSQIPTDDALNQAEALTPERFITTESATEFLDPQHRYQLLNSVSPLAKGEALAITVLDCQPLQLSPLQIWQQQLEANQLSDPDLEAIPGMENLIIPLAQAYLALEINYGQFLPPLHDAWNTADHEIILLADYSRLPLLQDHIAQQNVPSKQIIQWLQQMTALWVALEPLHCCQSLLELNNLRVSSEDPPSPETNPEVNPEKN
ncbi:MAG: hypothetical protein HC835_13065 [Oscillatoriales cyanobacterium RM2_1_1]|nr:hypothetical protein [Oscillatoriales cyanobacterium SM2_3_0]NJO46479.1 hypothetical protein [Oscillatoriales cyanobacterium RM2_1_1]